jgi:putative redox protein
MKKLKFTFKNAAGEELAGLLELPENPKAFALLAHCFTCGKDLKGAARIARKLTENAIAVLRFDFTGLGNSEGDFSNTNFSSNISDLLCAVDYLRRQYEAPSLLIGHSLGIGHSVYCRRSS